MEQFLEMDETLMEENQNKFDNIELLEVDDNAITLDFRVFVLFFVICRSTI
jgi:hypothetical protein